MVRLKLSIELNYEIDQPGCDFIFSIHAAQTRHQTVVNESLNISQNLPFNLNADPVTHTRIMRLKAFAGPLLVRCDATVDIDHFTAPPEHIHEVPVASLPGTVLPYIYPTLLPVGPLVQTRSQGVRPSLAGLQSCAGDP